MSEAKEKTVDLVLSSGGARGMAHMGIIAGFEENGWKITSVAGSSAGAIIGGLYACGKLDDFREWICSRSKDEIFHMVDLTFTRNGFVKADRLFAELARFIGNTRIEDLKIPFVCVACDVLSHKEIVFEHGPLLLALRSSIAIPSVVTPVRIPPKLLVDGGVCNPIPIAHIRRTKGARLAVSDVNANIPYHRPAYFNSQPELKTSFSLKRKLFEWLAGYGDEEDKSSWNNDPGMFDVINASLDIMQDRISELTLIHYLPDFLFQISREAAGTLEFYRAAEMLAAGNEAFRSTFK